MEKPKYLCKACGSDEFISSLKPVYDVYTAEGDNLVFQAEEFDETSALELFCRRCGVELEFDENDLQ